jgi:hypothetical protein
VGYVAEEFLLDGTAAAYEAEPGAELTVDGKWRVRPSSTAPFRTRVLVVRPVDRARFNGIGHVNWQNVTAGFELVSPTLSPSSFSTASRGWACLPSVSECMGSLAVSSSRRAAGIQNDLCAGHALDSVAP